MEPGSLVAGVSRVRVTDSSGGSLQDLYGAAYPRLVGVVGAVARDRHDAERAVQEAFVRLMGCGVAVRRPGGVGPQGRAGVPERPTTQDPQGPQSRPAAWASADVPEGTVKSRLFRARATLTPSQHAPLIASVMGAAAALSAVLTVDTVRRRPAARLSAPPAQSDW